ncbi:MAG TPA: glucose-6-phosphate dehydrogenase [Stellaceae bacterium]|nr:glucose-6-phosphate dehydrogenase [Stellaceae bacterium]
MALTRDQRAARQSNPCSFVIFGASGDLTARLLVPALYRLRVQKRLPDAFAIIGLAHSHRSDDEFRRGLKQALEQHANEKLDPAAVAWLLERSSYVQGEFEDAAAYDRLDQALAKIEGERQIPGNRVFYLATPPTAFVPIVKRLGEKGLAREKDAKDGWRRVIIEKPFGTDVISAQALNRELLTVFAESQIYRIDHFLGKETVQNILALRFANGIFESLWNRDRIDHVQITAAETVAVEGRGKFYDATGALRDMVPNHLFQILTLVAMEPPTSFTADEVRAEKAKVLHAVHPFTNESAMRDAVRGQYGPGTVGGKNVVAYRQEPNVARASTTETFVALRLMIDNWRWAGVPFYLRTGKALVGRRTEVAIKFKEAPFTPFRDTPIDSLGENFAVIRIQPDEGIALQFNAKVPGQGLALAGVRMDFKYKDYFETEPSNGYETLLYDCMIGDMTLFQQADEIETGWRIVQPFLDDWREGPARDLAIYPAGSEGPPSADDLMARDGRHWRRIEVGQNRP